MANLQIPLNSHINTSHEGVITDISTQEKTVLDKKNTLRFIGYLTNFR